MDSGGPGRGEAHRDERRSGAERAPVLRGEHVVLRLMSEADVAPLATLLAHPEIQRWWLHWDEQRVRRELLHDKDAAVYVIEIGGQVGGIIMYTEENDPDYRFAQIDVTVGAEYIGKGLGTEALRVLIAHLIRDRGHHHVLIDPSVDNARAIRAYEKVGFKPVGVLRQYERREHGWGDAMLMDLVADEFELPGGA